MINNYTLRDGLELPQVGFGTYTLRGAHGVAAMTSALAQGYRLLDTAVNYENEGAVGAAVKRSGIRRSEITIVSKLPGRYYRRQDAITAIQESLYRTGLEYFDMYLLHWPNPKQGQYVEAWQALIDAQQMGLIRSIGVCNFLPDYLDRLNTETGVLPSVNQVELHPYFNEATVRAYDQKHQILTEAWSPLGRAGKILQEPVLQRIAKAQHRSIAQVILRWELQLGVLPIPKSQHPVRQRENIALFDFELSPAEMAAINALSQPAGRIQQQDPSEYEEF